MHYIKSSLFYHPEHWASLISEGIRPWRIRHQHLNCLVSMNDERGPHIRLVIAAEAAQFSAVVHDLHQHLEYFLRQHPSPPLQQSYRNTFFMNFPSNQVGYNLFHHAPHVLAFPSETLSLDDFFESFSDALVNMNAKVLEEMLGNRFVFSLQLLVILSFCFADNVSQARQLCNKFLHRNFSNPRQASAMMEKMEREYVPYGRDLQDLISGMWTQLQACDPSWIFHPIKVCFQNLLKKICMLQQEDLQLLALHQTFRKVNQALCVSNEPLTTFFVAQTLQRMPS